MTVKKENDQDVSTVYRHALNYSHHLLGQASAHWLVVRVLAHAVNAAELCLLAVSSYFGQSR